MTRMCDTGYRECPRQPTCGMDCHFTTAGLEPKTRKVKPHPAVPEDIEPVPETWHRIGAFMLWSIFTVLAVICLGLFLTGAWIWSLLI
jgi:hypothetical protein